MMCFFFISALNHRLHVNYDNSPMQYTQIFHVCKNGVFQMKNYDNFLILAQNIDRGFTRDPCFGAKIRRKYIPVNPSFTIIFKWDVTGCTLYGRMGIMFSFKLIHCEGSKR